MRGNTHECRSCGKSGWQEILDLGDTPLANAYPLPGVSPGSEKRYPLEVVLCPHCSLVQITETVPPDILFRDYLYFSSFSDALVVHAAEIADHMMKTKSLGASSLVMEAASNDGYLLQHYLRRGIPVLGIEPARNVAEAAVKKRGIPTLVEFFGRETAEALAARGQRADVFHAHNVLAHVADLNGFVSGISTILKEEGVAVLEFPYLFDLLDHVEFDTIYHEHLCYYSLTALKALFGRHGLVVADVERLAIHGGSLRLFVRHEGPFEPTERVRRMEREEEERQVRSPDGYRDFARKVGDLKTRLVGLLRDLKADGKRLAAYGAAAKGSTLLNTFGIGPDLLDFVADRSTVKQGRRMPGVGLPILPPDALLERRPDYALLLTWNFADEILSQQAEYRRAGGRFILPVPEPRIV